MKLSKKLKISIAFIVFLSICIFFKSFFLKNIFYISGEITISPYIENYFKYNNMLFIIVKNSKDIPVAVKKIINPVFPLKFSINKENLLFPNILTSKVTIYAVLNSHGEIGKLKKGDLYTSSTYNALLFARNLKIEIDSKY